jgi:hypothetical protein
MKDKNKEKRNAYAREYRKRKQAMNNLEKTALSKAIQKIEVQNTVPPVVEPLKVVISFDELVTKLESLRKDLEFVVSAAEKFEEMQKTIKLLEKITTQSSEEVLRIN